MRRAAGLILLALCWAAPALTQGTVRLATLDALREYPAYFHLQPVVVRGTVTRTGDRVTLRTEAHEMRLLVPPGATVPEGPAEARGVFVDVGKLDPGDPRLGAYDRPADAAWPRPGEELLLRTERVFEAPARPALSLRTLALEPWRYQGQVVTLVGQFRGRNLFGDQPSTPRIGTTDFVLRHGDASVWVTGLRPKGRGFDLDVGSRIDSRFWLEATGTVRFDAGLVRIEATRLAEAAEPDLLTTERDAAPVAPPPSPPVEVVFSDPTTDEAGVPLDGTIRVQFSRNVDEASLEGQIRLGYAGDTDLPFPEWYVRYNAGTHAMEIRFARPLDPDMGVRLDLLAGIRGFDQVALVPWSLSFRTAR